MAGLKGQTGTSMGRIMKLPKMKFKIICFQCYYSQKEGDKKYRCVKKGNSIYWEKPILQCKNFIKKNSDKAKKIHAERINKAKAFLNKLKDN